MFQIHFSDVNFAQASKYVMIVKTTEETKRSEICSLWTSAPQFNDPVIINSLQDLTIKACTATIDKKLVIIGLLKIQLNELNKNQQIIVEQNKNFIQKIQDKQIIVGNCKLTIKKIVNKQPLQTDNTEPNQIGSQYELKSQQDQSQPQQAQQTPKCQLKLIIHGGFDFYLNSAFKVCTKWGSQQCQTKFVTNRLAPFWGEVFNIQGRQWKNVLVTVQDDQGSQLEWIKLNPKLLRIMYPYHLHIYFREEYMGLHPHFFITVIREDVPLFSILDRKINMKIGYLGPLAPLQTQQYILIYPKALQGNEVNKLPIFIQLNMKNFISFDMVNKIIQQNPQKKYQWTNWNILFPISLQHKQKNHANLSILKSFINKSLVCMYFSLGDAKSLFCQQGWNSVNVLDRKQSFQNNIKQLYYQQKKILLGKTVQLSNSDTDGLENEEKGMSLQDKWKILTHNYILRKKMLVSSIDRTESTKKQIKQKGQYLQQLKKILIQVKKKNAIMIEKQKSTMIEQNRRQQKIKDNYQIFELKQIIKMLYEKQIQLQKRKHINDQMKMRMDSLLFFNQDSQQLNKIIVQNAQYLLQQQLKIKQMNKMKQTLPKQRQVILKLQKIFQQRQLDRQMNQILKKQQNKLSQIKKINNKNLEYVYNIVKEHRNGPYSLLQSIKAAETQLISLNAHYAKLTTM